MPCNWGLWYVSTQLWHFYPVLFLFLKCSCLIVALLIFWLVVKWCHCSLEPWLFVPDFVSQLWRKIRFFSKAARQNQNRKPGFEANVIVYLWHMSRGSFWKIVKDFGGASLTLFPGFTPHLHCVKPRNMACLIFCLHLCSHSCFSSHFLGMVIYFQTAVVRQPCKQSG